MLLASTPSEDQASGDSMAMKTGTLGPADKDRRSKKKCVQFSDPNRLARCRLLPSLPLPHKSLARVAMKTRTAFYP